MQKETTTTEKILIDLMLHELISEIKERDNIIKEKDKEIKRLKDKLNGHQDKSQNEDEKLYSFEDVLNELKEHGLDVTMDEFIRDLIEWGLLKEEDGELHPTKHAVDLGLFVDVSEKKEKDNKEETANKPYNPMDIIEFVLSLI